MPILQLVCNRFGTLKALASISAFDLGCWSTLNLWIAKFSYFTDLSKCRFYWFPQHSIRW